MRKGEREKKKEGKIRRKGETSREGIIGTQIDNGMGSV